MIIVKDNIEAISTNGTQVLTLLKHGHSHSIGDLVCDPVTDDYYYDVFNPNDDLVLSLEDMQNITWIMEELNK